MSFDCSTLDGDRRVFGSLTRWLAAGWAVALGALAAAHGGEWLGERSGAIVGAAEEAARAVVVGVQSACTCLCVVAAVVGIIALVVGAIANG